MIRMAVFDLDETLLRTDKTVSGFTVQTLMRLRAMGVKLAFATARGKSVGSVVPQGLFDGQITYNGAVAAAEGVIVYNRMITPELYRPILQKMKLSGYEMTDFTNLKGDVGKLHAVVKDEEHVRKIMEAISDELYVHISKDSFAMIMHCEATKKHAVLALAAHWGTSAEEIVAFGDDVNDIDMLQCCGTGVAMGNALESVKAVADEVCGTNNEDGAANWLISNVITK